MIAVVADDLTGAAEIAGIGFARELSSEVHTSLDAASRTDLVAIDANSRCLSEPAAGQRVADVVGSLGHLRPSWIYKKVDSVLRGPVLAELRSMLAATGKRRAILVPVNPSRDRIIRDGRYFVDGRPIDQSAFADDPQHPARCSDVLGMLGGREASDVRLARLDERLSNSGIIIGEASTTADVARWAERIDESTLPAGAADFFAALATARGFGLRETPPVEGESAPLQRTLFVCGSDAAWSRGRRDECAQLGIPIVSVGRRLPEETTPDGVRLWAEATLAALNRQGVAMLAVGEDVRSAAGLPSAWSLLIEVVAELLGAGQVNRLFVEGGGTASTLVRRMGWTRMSVCRQYSPGVVAMRIAANPQTVLTVKPGSYPWPSGVFAAGGHLGNSSQSFLQSPVRRDPVESLLPKTGHS